MDSFEQVFEAVSAYCLERMSATSHKLFIQPLTPVSLSGDTAVLSISSDFLKNTIQEKFSPILEEGFAEVLGFPVTVQVISLQSMSSGADPAVPDPTTVLNGPRSYTFDTFVVGSGNRFAHAAAQAVAGNPAGAYNPLFIYGQSGLGKTHLLHAIKNELAVTRPNYKVEYVPCESFVNELIAAIGAGQNSGNSQAREDFRNRYRKLDVLLIDDVQFISGKEATQDEFFNTFNTLFNEGKQIVLTADRPPREIRSLAERLRSRFESGLLADLEPPEYETRVSILMKKASQMGFPLPNDVAQYIADNLTGNVRQLEGIINKLYAYRIMDNVPPTIANAQAAIKDVFHDGEKPLPVTVDKIIEEVSRTFNISVDDIKSSKRDEEIASARQIAMYCIREITGMTMEDIGKEFSDRNHSTVTHSIKKASERMASDQNLKYMVEDIIKNSKN